MGGGRIERRETILLEASTLQDSARRNLGRPVLPEPLANLWAPAGTKVV